MIGAPIEDAGVDGEPMTRTAAGLDIPMFDAFLDSLWACRPSGGVTPPAAVEAPSPKLSRHPRLR
jgi:hypothetical protein